MNSNWRFLLSSMGLFQLGPNRRFKLSTYGMDEIGDVPRSAFVIRLTPMALIKRPTRNTRYRFALSNCNSPVLSQYSYAFCCFRRFSPNNKAAHPGHRFLYTGWKNSFNIQTSTGTSINRIANQEPLGDVVNPPQKGSSTILVLEALAKFR